MKKRGLLMAVPLALAIEACCTETISLGAFLEMTKESHPLFRKEELSVAVEQRQSERFLGTQDWVFRTSPTFAYQEPVSSDVFTPESVETIGIETAVERGFWNTGGRLSFSLSSGYVSQEFAEADAADAAALPADLFGTSKLYQNRAFLTYSHPLMQNAGGNLDRLDYDLSRYDIDFAHLQSLENQEAFLLELSTGFLEWVLLSEQQRIANERLTLAEDEYDQVRRKRDANLVDEVDVLRAEDAVNVGKQNVMLVESRWKAKQAELATLAQSKEIYGVTPTFELYKERDLPEVQKAVENLRAKSRVLELLRVRREQFVRAREAFADIVRPQLSVNVGAGLQGGDEDFGDSLHLDQPDAFVSLEFRYPFGNRTAKADLERTTLKIAEIDEEIGSIELDLEASSRNILIQIGDLKEVLQLNRDQMESAEKKTEEELKLYNQGRGQLTFVIQSRDNQRNAELIYARNAASYHNLILQYLALADELLMRDWSGEEERDE
jgi:outer membrane protein TolC